MQLLQNPEYYNARIERNMLLLTAEQLRDAYESAVRLRNDKQRELRNLETEIEKMVAEEELLDKAYTERRQAEHVLNTGLKYQLIRQYDLKLERDPIDNTVRITARRDGYKLNAQYCSHDFREIFGPYDNVRWGAMRDVLERTFENQKAEAELEAQYNRPGDTYTYGGEAIDKDNIIDRISDAIRHTADTKEVLLHPKHKTTFLVASLNKWPGEFSGANVKMGPAEIKFNHCVPKDAIRAITK